MLLFKYVSLFHPHSTDHLCFGSELKLMSADCAVAAAIAHKQKMMFFCMRFMSLMTSVWLDGLKRCLSLDVFSRHNLDSRIVQCLPPKLEKHHNLKTYGKAKCRCHKEIFHPNFSLKTHTVDLSSSCHIGYKNP